MYLKDKRFRQLIAEFELFKLATCKRKATYRSYSDALESFFGKFYPYKELESFCSFDVADWREMRKADGLAEGTIKKEAGFIKTFFNWLIETKSLFPAGNPVV